MSRTGEADTITSDYLVALGGYRALYILNWIYRYALMRMIYCFYLGTLLKKAMSKDWLLYLGLFKQLFI